MARTRIGIGMLVGLWLLLAQAALAGQPALTAYQARLAVLRAQVPAVTASAQGAAELVLAQRDTRLSFPYWEQMSFAEEMCNRAGGLALSQTLDDDESDATRIVILSVRSWAQQADRIRERVRFYTAKGWTVTVIGSAAGRPKNLGAAFFIDNGAPSGAATLGRINVLANVTLGWMWCCEYAAALSRHGKFPPILQSVHVPGAMEFDARIQSRPGRVSLLDCPTAIPAGQLAGVYLDRLDKLVGDLNSPVIQGQLGTAAGLIADRLAAGGRVGIAGMGHIIIEEVMVDHATPWVGIRGVGNPDLVMPAHLRPGDLLIWMSYCGMNSPYDDYAKYIKQAKVDLVTCFAPDPEWSKDRPAETKAHIDQSWTLPDAEVPIPLFPNYMAPISGINVTLITRMLDDEVSARLRARGARVKPPQPLPFPPAYQDRAEWALRSEGSQGPAPVRAWGFVNAAGKLVAPMRYDAVSQVNEGRVAVRKDGKWGYLNEQGKVIIPMQFDRAGAFHDGTALVGKAGKFGYIDRAGTTVIPLEYDRIDEPMSFYQPWMGRYFGGAMPPRSLAFGKKGERWALLDTRGTVTVPPTYDEIQTFSDALVVIRQGKLFGLMRLNGEVAVAPKYDAIGRFRRGYATFTVAGKTGILDAAGAEIVPAKYDNLGSFNGELLTLRINGKWGGVTPAGTEVFPPKYDAVERFIDGVARVRLGKKWGAINAAGHEIVPVIYDDMRYPTDGLMPVCRDGKWGYVNPAGALVIPPQFDDAVDFTDGVAFVKVDGVSRLIDQTGMELKLPAYDYIADAGEGLLKVARDGKWGLIDKTGREIVPPTYAYFVSFDNGRAMVALGGTWREDLGKGPLLVGAKWGLIDKTGRVLVAPKYDRVDTSGDTLFPVARTVKLIAPIP